MKYAIVEFSGRQFWVEIGRYYNFDNLPLKISQQFNLNKILLLNDNGEILVGRPYLKNIVVKAQILGHFRGLKCIVYKMRPKKKTRKKQGHRQNFTQVLITEINYL